MIIQGGLSHAGTTSLHQALKILGYKAAHHQVANGLYLHDIINNNQKYKRPAFYPYDETYDCFLDWRFATNSTYVYHCYPDAKYILTTRDLDSYIESSVRFNAVKNVYATDYDIQMLHAKHTDINRIIELHKDNPNVLVMDICNGDGWEPLCKFLDKEVPHIPFPHLNKKVVI